MDPVTIGLIILCLSSFGIQYSQYNNYNRQHQVISDQIHELSNQVENLHVN